MSANYLNLLTSERIEKSPSGQDAVFIPLDKYSGIKLFTEKKIESRTYWFNKYLAAHGLAPKIWGRFSHVIKWREKPEKIYGYHVERAKVVCEDKLKKLIDISDHHAENYLNVFDEIAGDLEVTLREEHSICWPDAHPRNVGFLCGRPVIIDAGWMEKEQN